jgi:glutamate carboxypeptidase
MTFVLRYAPVTLTRPLHHAIAEASRVAAVAARDLDGVLLDLARWVAMDSPTGQRALVDGMAIVLAEDCRAAGLDVELVPAAAGLHVHAAVEGAGDARVALLCHHDTVFAEGTAAARPFRRSRGRCLGPGVADMKGGIAVALHAARLLARGPRPFARVELVSVPDEEVRTDPPATIDRLRDFDAVLCMECGRRDGSLVSARKGGLWLTVEAHGRSAHAGVDPESGRNAITALCSEALRLATLHGARDQLSAVVAQIAGGEVMNSVPERAWLTLDVRAALADDIEWARARAREWGDHDGVSLRVTRELILYPLERTPRVVRLAAAAVAIAAALGVETRDVDTGGASDACHAAALGIPTLDGLGPVGGLDHTPAEYVESGSFVPRIGMLAGLVAAVNAGLLAPDAPD